MSLIIEKVKELTMSFLLSETDNNISLVLEELKIVTGLSFENTKTKHPLGYESVQDSLGTINEKEYIRKSKGVYYTPTDVVSFVISNAVSIQQENTQDVCTKDCTAVDDTFLNKSVFDPTCGAGEFLLSFLEKKFDNITEPTTGTVRKIVATIHGNDINHESTTISKIRLLLCVYKYFGDVYTKGLGKVLNKNFTNIDFVATVNEKLFSKFDFIVGNPPYVEDCKCETPKFEKYGNIYCNVIANSIRLLKKSGSLGFIIPLSYISTPRMGRIRKLTNDTLSEQMILSFADRPDCLFTSVHQKLCILIGRRGKNGTIKTSGYQYWYKNERPNLFSNISLIQNTFAEKDFIPKLGFPIEKSIYNKIKNQPIRLTDFFVGDSNRIYLNMRACFWIKAFSQPHSGAEYKEFCCKDEENQQYVLGILNSSLFWWFWVCISDCWHITRKELKNFRLPELPQDEKIRELAKNLECKLELTKKYVGTKQTDYEYKHKSCLYEVEELDRAINEYFGLSNEESDYIISFAKRYRTGGGTE